MLFYKTLFLLVLYATEISDFHLLIIFKRKSVVYDITKYQLMLYSNTNRKPTY